MINGLIDRVQKTQLQEKDAEAEQLLQSSLGRNPDSLYILSQTVLVQQYALDQAQAQLTSLKEQVEQLQAQQQHPKPATSFLGGLFGGGSSDRQPAPPATSACRRPIRASPGILAARKLPAWLSRTADLRRLAIRRSVAGWRLSARRHADRSRRRRGRPRL